MADKDGMRGEEEAPAVAEDAAAAHEEIPEESFIPAELRTDADDGAKTPVTGPGGEHTLLRRSSSSGFRSADLEPTFNRDKLEEMRDKRRQWAINTLRPIQEFAKAKVIEGRRKLPTAREVMAKTKDMPSNVIKAGAELSKVDARKLAKEATKEAVRQIPREIRRTEEIDENTFAKALLTAIIGVLTGLAATWVQFFGVVLLYNPKMDLVESFVAGNNITGGFIVHFVISTIMSVGAAVLVVFVAPSATGAGFAEIKVSANGALYAKNTDDPKVLSVKIMGLCLIIGSGLPGARDFVHIGGLIASNVSNFWEAREKSMGRKSLIFQSNKNRLMFLASGVASAGGAAFRCPLGGVIWAFEEFSGFWTRETMGRCIMAALCATTTAWYFVPSQGAISDDEVNLLSGNYDFTIIRMDPIAHASKTSINLRIWEVPVVVILGIFGAIQGAAFVMMSGAYLAPLRKRIFADPKKGKYLRLVEIACVTLVASLAAAVLPVFWPCRSMYATELAARTNPHVHFREFNCPEGQINEMASLTFPAGFSVINNFFAPATSLVISPWALFVYGTVYYIITLLAVGVTAPTGPFVHLILVGGAWGRGVGEVLRLTVDPTVDVRLYAFLGMLACFCGFKRMALTLAAFFCELGSSIAISPVMMICAVITRMIGDKLTPSMTQFMCKFNNYPFLPDRGIYDQFRWFTAHDIMTEMRGGKVELPLVVGETDTIEHCEEMLATDHDSYPVVASRPDNMQVVGLMRRATMIKALKVAKSREDRTVNFGRMMELCPWMVPDTMPANRAYKTFIKMGLRQLLVVKEGTHEIVGIITRHDLHCCLTRWPAAPNRDYLASLNESQNQTRPTSLAG